MLAPSGAVSHNARMATVRAFLAFDRSVRHFDEDGRLHVASTPISKATVNPYYGWEIPNGEALGLQPDKVYYLLRDPDELAKAAPTFNNLPLLIKHVRHTADEPQKESVVGSIGSDVAFEAPYLVASLCVYDAGAIEGIESRDQVELSASYHYDAVMEPGEYEGQRYDGRMTNIRGNHLALVEAGRAGPDVLVADSNPFAKGPSDMKPTKLGKALLVALSAASTKLAADAALPALVGAAQRKTFDRKAVRAKLIAMDAEIDPQQLDDIIDAILGIEDNPEPAEPPAPVAAAGGEDESPLEEYLKSCSLSEEQIAKIMELAKPEEATDEDPAMKPEDVEQKVTEAMDSMRKEFRALEQAKVDVRDTVGDVLGMDSAEQVYRYAFDQMKVDHKDVPAAGLRAMFNAVSSRPAAKSAIMAHDAKLTEQFPGLSRIRHA